MLPRFGRIGVAVGLTRQLWLIVGLGPGVTVTEVRGRRGGPLVIGIELIARPCCGGCGGRVWVHDENSVALADLPAFGRPTRLVWNKRRWRCRDEACRVCTFTEQQPRIAPPRARMTSRAARWATRRAGKARAVSEIAAERVTERVQAKLRGLLAAGDHRGEVRDAWHAKETLRGICRIGDRGLANETLDELARDLRDETFSPELNKLGRTLRTWRAQITNWHRSRVSNGPTEAAILWSVSEGVGDVADGHMAGGRGRVLWSVSLESAMLLAA